MATTSREIKNGQVIAAPVGEVEIRLSQNVPNSRKVGFLVTSGTMQVTVATKGSEDVIGGEIHPFANTNYPIEMTVEPAVGSTGDQDQKNIFIKGGGTIVFFW